MKKLSVTLLFSLIFLSLSAQQDTTESESPFSFEAQLISRYVWRGQDLGGNRAFVHPSVALNLGNENHAFSAELWGAYALGKHHDEELNLILTYTFKEMVELIITDYFVYDQSPDGYDLFNYRDGETPHLLEAGAGFAGTENFPFSLHAFMMLYGDDVRKINADGTEGRIFRSSYVELGYAKELSFGDMNAFVGFAPDKANEEKGEETFYGNTRPGFVNLGCSFSRELNISKQYSPVLDVSFIVNPASGAAFFTAGITF
jgi:hypothetical protein